MKKLVILLVFTLFVFALNAQTVRVLATDTLQGNETVNFTNLRSSSSDVIVTLQAVCTELGGTSDGTLILQGSVDGLSFVTLQDQQDLLKSYPNDTLTITDGAVGTWNLLRPSYKYYRVQGGGTASDTTLVVIKYHAK